ncbi:hypothetical protein PAXINDRAFT_182934 [Paxillus involutus ATCC 200175]|uniref:Uncharacterized protein n=1 Tax=Paxillus involutus ATCC 200175 TaxID=664439 RepID=A0A0C9STD5_PAXIN|nr:hypothetical protein PAXINDRAFT_182934 [Paxillus involutus ATCC 200175]
MVDQVPSIDSPDPGGLKPEKVLGEITLEDVKFNYPSRPGVPIVKGLNNTFPARKTAALVGTSRWVQEHPMLTGQTSGNACSDGIDQAPQLTSDVTQRAQLLVEDVDLSSTADTERRWQSVLNR